MSPQTLPSLDLVLPCYNPAPDWHQTIIGSMALLKTLLPDTRLHVYLVNDGSSRDLDPEDIKKIQAQVPDLSYISYDKNRGKGYALRKGISETQNDYCIYTDIDFPYEEYCVAEMYQLLISNEYDIVAGIRDSKYYEKVPFVRTLISKFLKGIIRLLLKIRITDTQAGLKGFNRKGRSIFLKTRIDRYLFDLEFIYLGSKDKQARLRALPVRLKPGVVFSHMNARILFTEFYNFIKVFFRKT